jgi:predicted  nucleic acid-binding Zn-ribbon protein
MNEDAVSCENNSRPQKRHPHVEFWVALALVIIFVLMSMYLVLQIRDADRAEDREKAACTELEALSERIPAQKAESAVMSEKITSLKAELAGLQENYEKLKDQYDKADAVVSARNQASQEYSDLTARIRAGENNLEQLQSERDQLLVVLQDARSKRSTEQQAVAVLKVDNSLLGQLMLKEFHEQVVVSNGEATFRGAEQVADQMAQDEVPYYDRIAPVLLYYQGRDKFNDPIIHTKPLIEGRIVAAGKVAKTEEPIREFSIPRGKDSLDLILKREFGKEAEIKKVTAGLREQTISNEAVEITAEIRAGQGFAKAHVVSVKPCLFESLLNWRTMKKCDEPEQPKYAWPPGVANVHSNVTGWDLAPFIEISEILSDFDPRKKSPYAISEFRQYIASWIPRDAPYQYDGKIASSDSFSRFTQPEVLHDLSQNLGDAIDLAPKNDQLIRLAGWMYEACPQSAIDAAVKRIKKRNEMSCDLEVAGKAFVKKEHVKIFVEMFVERIRELSGDYSADNNNNWLRAFRDMTRFRVNTLKKDFILDTQIRTIEKYVIGLMYYESNCRGPKYNNCLYIAPHLLKRRRFDDHFLSLNSRRWDEWMKIFTYASKVGNPRQKDMAKAMLKVLKAEATLSDIKILASNEG